MVSWLFFTFCFKVQPNCSFTLPAPQGNPAQPKTRKETIDWPDILQGTVKQHLQHLVKPPILAHTDFRKPFVLHTDASGLGLGCTLFQLQDENLTVIGFGSSALVGAKMKQSSSKLELMALKWEVCELLTDYLFYVPHFDVYTEYNPLTYIINT